MEESSSHHTTGAGLALSSRASSFGEDEDRKDNGEGSSSKRQRVHFSCTECHRRKQKCNRQTPCQHCIARKIPERCKTFQPGEDPTDVTTRVVKLERSVQEGFQRVFELLQQQQQQQQRLQQTYQPRRLSASTVNAADAASSIGLPPSSAAAAQQILAEAAGSEAGDEVLEGNQEPNANQYVPSKAMTMKIDNLLDSFTGTQGATASLTDPTKMIEGGTDLDSLMHEYGATESVSQSLLSVLPSREVADALVNHFFEDINWLRQPLSQRLFRINYNAFWASGPTLTADNINYYASIVLLMAIAICSIERPDMVPEDPRLVRLTARRLGFAGRRALLVSTILGREDIHQVVAYSMASRFLLLDRRITEAWTCVANAVKTAHSLGLHRDGLKLHLSKYDTEMRRRIWSFIYFTDRVLCMNLGRPTQIDDNVIDTQMPSEEDDLDMFPDMFKPAPMKNKPEGHPPSPLSYTKHRHRLAVIMGKIISTYQNLHTPAHYSDIVSIDKELQAHRNTLPSYFRSDTNKDGELYHVNPAWDEGYPFVPIHRYLIESEIDHIRVSLHRPYLLRPSNKAGHRYEYSRRSCIAAAHRNILLRKDVTSSLRNKFGEGKIPKAFHLHLGTYKTLNSLVIIGIYLLVTPDAEDAEMLLGHLRFYSDIFKKKKLRKDYVRDEVKDREASIIQLFLQRIEETREAAAEAAKKGGRKKNGKGGGGQDADREEDASVGGPAAKRLKRGNNLRGGKTTDEEDTAGVLLDLNQSRRGTEGAAPPYHEYVSGWSGCVGGRGHNGGASHLRSGSKDGHSGGSGSGSGGGSGNGNGEIMAPWPYLPLNTHQNTPSRPPSLSNGSGVSPANESFTSDDGSATNATSAQQIFESWFRYNAFDTMDFDLGNTGLDAFQLSSSMQMPLGAAAAPGEQGGGQNNSNSGKTGGNSNIFQPVPMTLDGQTDPNNALLGSSSAAMGYNGRNQNDMSSYPPISSSGIQLSTLPAPTWGSNRSTEAILPSPSNAKKQQQQQQQQAQQQQHPNYSTLFNNSSSSSSPALPFNSSLASTTNTNHSNNSSSTATGGPATSSTSNANAPPPADQFNDVSFDPLFWQSLIDKISS